MNERSELPAPLRELVSGGPLAHLVTLNADGSPQVSVVWIGVDGDEIVSAHMTHGQKLRNVERDPRVVISLEAPRAPGVFLAEYAVLHGRAHVVVGGAYELVSRLGKVYVGPQFVFPTDFGTAPEIGFVLRTTVQRVGGIGPWIA